MKHFVAAPVSLRNTVFRVHFFAGKICRYFAASLPATCGHLPEDVPANSIEQAPVGLARLLHYDTAQTNFSYFPAMIDRIEQDLSFTRTALGVRGYRQELLASNIANADTPNFKARDVDFKSALGVALGSAGADAGAPLPMTRTRAGHQAGTGDTPYGAAVKYRAEYQGAVDGNTVNMDVERAAFAENALQVEALITFINSRFRTMSTAIQGQ